MCNQSAGLIARTVEDEGISTLLVSFRRDIVQLSRPPRVLYYKSSAGKPLGTPGDKKTQRKIIEAGFNLMQKDIDEMTIIDI